jgi:hypothetical protein
MILHHNTLVSLDIIQKKFICNLDKCYGACCVEGDYGAPLEDSELIEIENNLSLIRKHMTSESLQMLDNDGFYEKDPFDIYVTKCVGKADCIFCFKEGKIARCAIEKAHTENEITFRKPVSCHLYPIRISKMKTYETMNYHEWDICKAGRELGDEIGMPLYKFLKEPIIRKYGKDWYNEFEEIAEEFIKEGTGI